VNWRRSAWNRLRVTWRCMTPHSLPVGFRWGAGRRGRTRRPGRSRKGSHLRVVLAGVVQEDMDHPAARTGALQRPQDRPGAGPPAPGHGEPHRPRIRRPVRARRAGRPAPAARTAV